MSEKTEKITIWLSLDQTEFLDLEGKKKGGLSRQDTIRVMIAEKMEATK